MVMPMVTRKRPAASALAASKAALTGARAPTGAAGSPETAKLTGSFGEMGHRPTRQSHARRGLALLSWGMGGPPQAQGMPAHPMERYTAVHGSTQQYIAPVHSSTQ